MKKILVLYVEGQTDEQFYNKIKNNLRKKLSMNEPFNVKIKCVKSITRFNSKLLKKFKTEIISEHKEDDVIVFLCYDGDVFEYGIHPPVDSYNYKEI